jgi:demethylmenaquinone methyltransferase/2-methoxy-6-polyprenyl-1,4-benzoquinol methylase
MVAAMDPLLTEQIAYYRAIAAEYHDHAIDETGGSEAAAAIAATALEGDVLELACGPGTWTPMLAKRATTLTAVDASPEMLALAARSAPRARFIEADLFTWEPDRRYDGVFFGFWISHVPEERFDAFWALVARALKPEGRVVFVDDGFRSADELVYGEDSERIRRRLNDGSEFNVVKVAHEPQALENRLRALGWDVRVSTAGPFYWGEGSVCSQETHRDEADTGSR